MGGCLKACYSRSIDCALSDRFVSAASGKTLGRNHVFMTKDIREWILQQYSSMEDCVSKYYRMVVNHCYATEDDPLCLLLSMKAQVIGAAPAQLVRKALLEYRV